jgi:hypothetical protein
LAAQAARERLTYTGIRKSTDVFSNERPEWEQLLIKDLGDMKGSQHRK